MLDTTLDAQQKQLDIILAKTEAERAMMGVDMIDTVYQAVKQSIQNQHPEYSERALIAALFVRYYKNEFAEADLLKIVEGIKYYI
ncbi:MAG: hypothetical protein IPJ74_22865 [Saprospiraceae bacterium]|nr:hypothetical protein [Saprospiraceae bacterium]